MVKKLFALLALILVACTPVVVMPETTMQAPTLERGTPLTAASLSTMAVDDECSEDPLMIDNRSLDDPSYQYLPRLESGDYDKAQTFAGFELSHLYGCELAQPGQWYWQIVSIELKCGPAVLQPFVMDDYGTPMSGILAFMNWSDAPPLPNGQIPDPPYFTNAIGGFTDGGGSVGWGFGPGSQLTPGQGGPFSVWLSSDPITWPDRRIGSDALLKIGWFDNHCIFNPQFQQVEKSGALPPVADGDYLGVWVDGVQEFYIPLIPGSPSESGFSGLGMVGEDDIIWYVPGVVGIPTE